MDAENNLDLEKTIVKIDNERMMRDREFKRNKKLNMAATLKESLIRQQNEKVEKQREEQERNKFNYCFPL